MPALRSTAEANNEDLLLVFGPVQCNPFLSGRGRNLRVEGFHGMLFLVLDAALNEGDPLLDLDPIIDLGPLCEAVASSLGRTAGAERPPASAGQALRAARAAAVHQALYPEIPLSQMPPIAHPGPGMLFRQGQDPEDSAGYLSDEHWEVPTTTLDGLILASPIRTAFDTVVRAAQQERRAVILLHGPPGTGKSMAAHCLAGTLGRPLYRVQGSLLRGRFYGEFEGRLAAVFAEAQKRSAVLLIDEADEWVGRREGSVAQVGGAHILESSQMLQALEHYGGVAILTTNRSETLDPALSRRVDAWIHLQLPAMEERMALWVLALGDAPPLRPVDLLLLTAIPLSGGEIVACAREVACTGGSLTTPALLAAARRRSERRVLTGD